MAQCYLWVDGLIGCWVDGFSLLFGGLVGGLVGWLIGRLIDVLMNRLVKWWIAGYIA